MDSKKIPGKIEELLEIIDRLLGDGGCPWDKEQTLSSMVKNLIEETYELADSIRENGAAEIVEELGDLQFIVLFLGRLAEKEHGSGMAEAVDSIKEKLIRRHPHVFGNSAINDSKEVLKKWEEIKETEKDRSSTGPLAGVPKHLPAMIKAFRIGEKLNRRDRDPWIGEDPLELLSKALRKGDSIMLGKGLYVLVGKARESGLDANEALQAATEELRKNFS